MTPITLELNGKRVVGAVEPRTHLADFIREQQNFTGTHLGCEHGVCGACTLMIDGMPARSCITYAVACDGATVTTIEGLDDDEIMRQLRDAFTREHALQCGYCTPGMLVSARDLVVRMATPDEQAIRIGMSGNLCRCTGYVGIVRAVQAVIAERRRNGIAAIGSGERVGLGPVGSGHAPTSDERQPSGATRRVSVSPVAAPAGTEVKAPALDPNWKPQATFDQTFTVSFPRETVWRFFGRVGEVAACLPGTTLRGTPTPEHAEGQIRVKVGPIAAEFRGAADIERDDPAFAGRIQGYGSDARSNSATRGEVRYRLIPIENGVATRVEITVGYTLTGSLAQFGRSGIVQDVAGRLTAVFAQNLVARLGGANGAGAAPPVTELNAGTLVWSVLVARAKGLWRRLARRD